MAAKWKRHSRAFPYKESIEKYGSDKPDLRIPFELTDVSEFFKDEKQNGLWHFRQNYRRRR